MTGVTEVPFTVAFRFTSDWSVGTGAGLHGSIDRATITDHEDGLPYVPAKSAVGILRDAAEVAAGALDEGSSGVWGRWVEAVFGSEPAHVSAQPSPRPSALLEGPLVLDDASRELVADSSATVIRVGVSIDRETGTALRDQLRFEERASAGLTLTSRWSLNHPDGYDSWPAKFLILAAAGIVRSAGGKRRRGAGAVNVEIDDLGGVDDYVALLDGDIPAPWPNQQRPGEEPTRHVENETLHHAHDLIVTVIRPVVVDAGKRGNLVRTLTFIPGTMLLPIIRDGLGDPSLADLIRADSVIVTDATPQVDGKRSLPWPRAVARSKDADPADVTYINLTTSHLADPRLKAPEHRYVTEDLTRWAESDIMQGIHAVIDDKEQHPTSETGGLFVYEGIAPGTVLRANVFLPRDMKLDIVGMKTAQRIGRSSKDDYGHVEIEVADPEPHPGTTRAINAGEEVRVWVTSDVLLRSASGGPDTTAHGLAWALGQRLGMPSAIAPANSTDPAAGEAAPQVRETIVSTVRRRESWHRPWGLPRPSLVGIRAGSVFVFRTDQTITQEDIEDLERRGVGERTAEGFGRVLLNRPALERETVAVQKSTSEVPVP